VLTELTLSVMLCLSVNVAVYCVCVTMITGILLDIHSDEIPSLSGTIQFLCVVFSILNTPCSEIFLVNKFVIIFIVWGAHC